VTGPALSPHLADEQLDDYADGLLAAPAREAADAHLAACAVCAGALAELRDLLARSAAERRAVEPPAALWPLVVAATAERPRLRRQLLRSLRAPLAAAAVALVVLSASTAAWLTNRAAAGGRPGPPPRVLHEESAAFDRALAELERGSDPAGRAPTGALRARLAAADDAVRGATDDERLYRALADRERLVKEIRSALGRGPRPPRAPVPPPGPRP
jgi:hypothetical protein